MSVELRSVRHRYAGIEVLREIDMALEVGTCVAIVGPSGSGKTTLLSILGLLLQPSEGGIVMNGEVVSDGGPSRRAMLRAQRVAWVFQTANAISYRTVLDNVRMGLLKLGNSRSESTPLAMKAIARVGLGGKERQLTRSLSGGELQRMCIARAIASQPWLLLADEPTGQLDRSNTHSVADALLGERMAGTTVVVATHDLDVAARCDRVLALVDGRLEQIQSA